MSTPPAGYYYIVNSDRADYNGSLLAITYDGNKGDPLTVTALDSGSAQEWYIADYGNTDTQTVSPTDDSSLQICFGNGNGIRTCSAGGYVWAITRHPEDDIYTFEDGGLTVFWGLHETAVDQHIYAESASNAISYPYWRLIASRSAC
ncbi:hypothetical protein OG21DRAFT_1514756 [Imleria badia]|nr:hypothetical protein OG21DRAFT_1514756 [Imleria badia]